MTERRIAVLRKFKLDGVSDGWDDCYISYTPATISEVVGLSEIDEGNTTNAQAVTMMAEMIKKHFVSGKVLSLDENDQPILDDAQEDDVDSLPPDVFKALYQQVLGQGSLDPKATPQAVVSDEQRVSTDAA